MSATKSDRPNSSTHVDLDAHNASEFFTMHVNSSEGPSKCWIYSKGKSTDSKKSVVWSECKRIVTADPTKHHY